VGYQNGKVEIRDSNNLKTEYFAHTFNYGSIVDCRFYLEKYAFLCLVHSENKVTNLILEYDQENKILKPKDVSNDRGTSATQVREESSQDEEVSKIEVEECF
jgi:hypothetical protein